MNRVSTEETLLEEMSTVEIIYGKLIQVILASLQEDVGQENHELQQ